MTIHALPSRSTKSTSPTPRKRSIPRHKKPGLFVASDHPPLDQVAPFFDSEETFKQAMADDARQKATHVALIEYTTRDHRVRTDMVTAGRIYYHFLKLPLAAQQEWLTAHAKALGVTPPNYTQEGAGRPTTGRTQLASVIYAKHSDWLKPAGNNKDSIAGKRVSDDMAAYKRSAGLTQSRPKTATPAVPHLTPALVERTFKSLYAVVENDTEAELLIKLFERTKAAEEAKLETWINELITALQAVEANDQAQPLAQAA